MDERSDAYIKDVLVETRWVEEHLDDDSVRFVEVDEEQREYWEGHVPGAVGLSWKSDLQDPAQQSTHILDSMRFSELLGRNGISNTHTVVLYGDHDNWFAAYVYWYLKYYGHDKVFLMNGSRKKWVAEGRPTEVFIRLHDAVIYTPYPGKQSIRAYFKEVVASLGGRGARLVDVRSKAEFAGELTAPPGCEQEGALRAGHIPGATSIPWERAVREDGTFKNTAELRNVYKNFLGPGDVVAYCRIGERSAHTWFVLHELLGKENVKNYDGSWLEWGSTDGAPVERGILLLER